MKDVNGVWEDGQKILNPQAPRKTEHSVSNSEF